MDNYNSNYSLYGGNFGALNQTLNPFTWAEQRGGEAYDGLSYQLSDSGRSLSTGSRWGSVGLSIGDTGLGVLQAMGFGALAPAMDAGTSGMRVALGVNENLDTFSQDVGGTTWKTWGANNFKTDFMDVMNNEANTIHFNLTGPDGEMLNAWKALTDTEHVTSWEMQHLYQNPAWQMRTTFYFNGSVVPNPWGL